MAWSILKQIEKQRAIFTGESTQACLVPLIGCWQMKMIVLSFNCNDMRSSVQ